MSLSKNFPGVERTDVLPPSHYAAIQTLPSSKRRKMIGWYLAAHREGQKIAQKPWRKRVQEIASE